MLVEGTRYEAKYKAAHNGQSTMWVAQRRMKVGLLWHEGRSGSVEAKGEELYTSTIRQMTYGVVPDALDEYLQMGATTTPTYTDIEKLWARHDEKHGFLGMIGSIDCTSWQSENCLVALIAQFCRGDHGQDPFILLEAIASQDLWIWHAIFGVSRMNNDVNVLRQSPIFNDLKAWKAPDVPFVANDVT
ncbi:ALP1-like protein [Tanacetum coccineum]